MDIRQLRKMTSQLNVLWIFSLLCAAGLSAANQTSSTPQQSTKSAKLSFIKLYNEKHADERPEFRHDVAFFTINSTVNFRIQLWAQSVDCYECDLWLVNTFRESNTTTMLVNTTHATRLSLVRVLPTLQAEDICSFTSHFKEAGDYWLFVDYPSYTSGSACDLTLANNPMAAEMPILFTLLGLFGLAGVWVLIQIIFRRIKSGHFFSRSANITDPTEMSDVVVTSNGQSVNSDKPDAQVENGGPPTHPPENEKEPPKKKRLRSLDAFRGLCLVVMIFVNYGGGGYWFFEHPPWNGLTVADLVFPWFIFIMGTSMNFSFRSMHKQGMTPCQMFFKIMKRSVYLFALGIYLNTSWGPVDLTQLRIMGVLQRFGVTYMILALVELVCGRKQDSHEDTKWAPVRDIILNTPQWIINLAFLATYVGLTYGLPIPGCPTGYTGPGGISQRGQYSNCTGGAARYIDEIILGNDHLYQFPTPMDTYNTSVPYDPEGLLGILTSVFMCFLGLQSGRIILLYEDHKGRIIRWLIWAAITGSIAAVLCKGSQNDGWIPLNKNLWSVSFVLTTGCFAFILLAIMYVFIDILDWWSGAPFIYPGMNSIVIYCCHDILWRELPINWQIEEIHWKLLLQDVWGAGFWCIVAYIMFKKKFFVAL
ncbi:heparan-alpha-glucosaminide N-acetyltransferase-like [Gigantopelta aegis]|uniref:heparan-alpha-glucosaminide N-acetyltransferase-like n=1 Tax=Gigantopelta aegis TaxID=1735272 RepID=UPI001B88CE4E|nr:heparan-alpha-glucosaminide N-acetyltransferase-like [Gigantopelta aegis]